MSAPDDFLMLCVKCTRFSTDDPTRSNDHPRASPSTSTITIPSNSDIQRHPDVWFDDGNLVLVAGKTAFRIYRGLLVSQSTVFADMFASSTSSPDETFDGCPLVHLSDSPSDLAHFLRVLLPTSRTHRHTTNADAVSVFNGISAIIRLAHKYDVPQVQDEALASLQQNNFQTSFDAYHNAPIYYHQYPLLPVHNVGVVNIARLTHTPSLLPLALYHCAYLGSALLDGWTREDGTVEHLSDSDLRRCLDAHAVLMHKRAYAVYSVLNGSADGCERPGKCAEVLRNLQGNVVDGEPRGPPADALASLSYIIELFGYKSSRICVPCTEELFKRDVEQRELIFNALPEIFGLAVEEGKDEALETEDDNGKGLGVGG